MADAIGKPRGGGLTGYPGDLNAKPIGTIRMDSSQAVSVSLNSWNAAQTYKPGDANYVKWIGHVGGLAPGEEKPIPPLHR